MSDNSVVLAASGIRKSFRSGDEELVILDGVDLCVERGESVAILGASGAGKSTLLQVLGGLDRPTEGKVFWQGEDVFAMGETKRGHRRNRSLGFIYQFHHLLPEFTALENVALPAMIGGSSVDQARQRAESLLEEVGLAERLRHKPAELSGGEKQRVAIARAIAAEPACILGDEPTGSLDKANADRAFETLLGLCRSTGIGLIVVTHDEARADQMGRRLRLDRGRLLDASAGQDQSPTDTTK